MVAHQIGPAAQIGFSSDETSPGVRQPLAVGSNPDNAVAMFRHGGRIAQLAATVP